MAHHDLSGNRSDPPEPARFWRRAALEATLWAAIGFGTWTLTLSQFNAEDAIVAAAASIGCGLFAVAGRWAIGERWAVVGVPLRSVLRLPLSIVLDSAAVLSTPLRRHRGSHFSHVRIDGAGGDGPRQAALRARATLLTSLSPGSFVCDIDRETGDALVHHLGGRDHHHPGS